MAATNCSAWSPAALGSPMETIEIDGPSRTLTRHEMAVRQEAQLGISPASRQAAMASSRKVDFSLFIENQW